MSPIRRLVSACLLSLALLFGIPAAASAYAPDLGSHFTNPPTGRGDNYIDELSRAIRNIPCSKPGAPQYLHFGEYHATKQVVADAIVSRAKCGVVVKGTFFQRRPGDKLYKASWDDLAVQIKHDVEKANRYSHVTICRYACGRSGDSGINHRKLYELSQSGTLKYVTFSGSGNASGDTDLAALNSWTVITDRNVWKAGADCITKQLADKAMPDCKPGISHDGKIRLDLGHSDPALALLKSVSCPKGWGSQVLLPMWGVTLNSTVDRLVWLDAHGCDVQVVGNSSTWDGGEKVWSLHGKKVTAFVYLKGHGVVVHEARKSSTCRSVDLYMHKKEVVAWAVQRDRDASKEYVTMTGSRNSTKAGTTSNDDQSLTYESFGDALKHRQAFSRDKARSCAI